MTTNLPLDAKALRAQIAKKFQATLHKKKEIMSFARGRLTVGDVQCPDDKIPVVLAGVAYFNRYFGKKFDPSKLEAPECYAIDLEQALLHPLGGSKPQAVESCSACPLAEWGTGREGRGTACTLTLRAVFFDARKLRNEEDAEKAPILGPVAIPVTSKTAFLKNVAMVVKRLQGVPHEYLWILSVLPDPKNQFRVEINAKEKLPDPIAEAFTLRYQEAEQYLLRGYDKKEEAASPKSTESEAF